MSQSTEPPLPWARTWSNGGFRGGVRGRVSAGSGRRIAGANISRKKKSTTVRGRSPHLGEGDGVRRRLGVAHAGRALDDVRLELVGGILDALGGLRARQRAVDAGGGLGAVAAEEGAFIQEEDAPAVLQHGVRGGEAGEAAPDDDDLFFHLVRGVRTGSVGGCRCAGRSVFQKGAASSALPPRERVSRDSNPRRRARSTTTTDRSLIITTNARKTNWSSPNGPRHSRVRGVTGNDERPGRAAVVRELPGGGRGGDERVQRLHVRPSRPPSPSPAPTPRDEGKIPRRGRPAARF